MQLPRRHFIALSGTALLSAALRAQSDNTPEDFDVCVYGATASGIAAALSVADQGFSVVIIEPSRWLGGMSGGGLHRIDWGTKSSVGGLALKMLIDDDNVAMRKLYTKLCSEKNIKVIYEHRLNKVVKENTRIQSITLDLAPPDSLGVPAAQPKQVEARRIAARIFIDCSYEGDLMAQAGVSHTYGRESQDTYGESYAGERPALVTYDIDPYNTPGMPSSGLLPHLQDYQPQGPGKADKLTMAYCFRWKISRQPDRVPFGSPENYDPRQYEIFRRAFKNKIKINAGLKMRHPGILEDYPGGGVFNENSSRSLWAQSVAGSNRDYPTGDWATRSKIWKFHQEFIRGMVHFLRTDESAPEIYKKLANETGLTPGIFDDTAGWPHQFYVREARRMQSTYVITQKDLEGRVGSIADSIGLGSYGIDDWPYATYADQGKISIGGGEFSILKPNPDFDGVHALPYRAIVPKVDECTNLLVPVCCSASHIAMTSIRMEPVWIILGQSAGHAAVQSLREKVPVQNINLTDLQKTLVAQDQKISWSGK